MHVRKQLLERELSKLGFRKSGQGAHEGATAQQQPQAGGSAHPQADDASEHGG